MGWDYIIYDHEYPELKFRMQKTTTWNWWTVAQEGIYSPGVIKEQLERLEKDGSLDCDQFHVEYSPLET